MSARSKKTRLKHPKAPSLRELFLEDLARSGLVEVDARRLKLRVLDVRAVERLGAPRGRAAYRIPYFTPEGTDTGYFRLRFLTGLDGSKPLRYWQPADSLPRLFFPRAKVFDLGAALADPQETLYVTEGEKKADRACLAGMVTVGLGGVWSWRSKRAGTPSLAIEDLDLVEWKDRRVVVVFDSDVSSKPAVFQAMVAFAKEVIARGGRPFSVRLPDGPDGAKTGLDDFLEEQGRPALDALEQEPLLGRLADDLQRLNEELVLVEKPPAVWRLKTREFLNSEQLRLLYGDLKVNVATERSVRQESVIKRWLEWGLRRRAPSLAFEPGQPTFTSKGEVNLWQGWGAEARPGPTGPWDELLDHLFDGQLEARSWFEDWCAYPLQHPGAKMYSAVVFYSLHQGVGKTLVGETLGRIYGDACARPTPEDLAGVFNPWAACRLFALGDEVTGSDKRRDADRFKNLVTREIVTVNVKYQPQYTLKDRLNYFFTTNHPDAFLLERGDRRFFVHEIRSEPREQAFYDTYDAWLRDGGHAHLFDLLLKRKLSGFNPRAKPPETEAKRDMTELSLSDLDGFVEQLRTDPDGALRLDGQPAEIRDLVTLGELLAFADPGGTRRTTKVALAKALRRGGFRSLKLIRLSRGPARLWAIRDQERWLKASPAAVKAEHERGRPTLTALEGGRKF